MRYASVLYRDYAENSLFKLGAGEINGEFCLPYAKLRKRFFAAGKELSTPDVNAGRAFEFELNINCRLQDPSARVLIRPLNRDRAALARYAKWFTWDGVLRDDSRTIPLLYTNRFDDEGWPVPEQRPLFRVLVASNKALMVVDPRDQYQARVRILDWYERHAPGDFHIYGRGWDRPVSLPGCWGRVRNQFRKVLTRFLPARSPYAMWRGPVDDKIGLLTHARLCLAHENCSDLTGYVAEKLFDSFRAGCVPVYVGPKEIADLVPAGCFIDGWAYETPSALDAFLRTIDSAACRGYRERIHAFLFLAQARPFSQDHFADVLAKEILADLPTSR